MLKKLQGIEFPGSFFIILCRYPFFWNTGESCNCRQRKMQQLSQEGFEFFLGEQGARAAATAFKQALFSALAPVNTKTAAGERTKPRKKCAFSRLAAFSRVKSTFTGVSSVRILSSAAIVRSSFNSVPGGCADSCVHGISGWLMFHFAPAVPIRIVAGYPT